MFCIENKIKNKKKKKKKKKNKNKKKKKKIYFFFKGILYNYVFVYAIYFKQYIYCFIYKL